MSTLNGKTYPFVGTRLCVFIKDLSELKLGYNLCIEYLECFSKFGGSVYFQNNETKLLNYNIILTSKKEKQNLISYFNKWNEKKKDIFLPYEFIEFIELKRFEFLKKFYNLKKCVCPKRICCQNWIEKFIVNDLNIHIVETPKKRKRKYKKFKFFHNEIPSLFVLQFSKVNNEKEFNKNWRIFFDDLSQSIFVCLRSKNYSNLFTEFVRNFFYSFNKDPDNPFFIDTVFFNSLNNFEYFYHEALPKHAVSFNISSQQYPIFVSDKTDFLIQNFFQHPNVLKVIKHMKLTMDNVNVFVDDFLFIQNAIIVAKKSLFWVQMSRENNVVSFWIKDRIVFPSGIGSIELEEGNSKLKKFVNDFLNEIAINFYEIFHRFSGTMKKIPWEKYNFSVENVTFQDRIIKLIDWLYGIGENSTKYFKYQNKYSIKFTRVLFKTNLSVIFLGKKFFNGLIKRNRSYSNVISQEMEKIKKKEREERLKYEMREKKKEEDIVLKVCPNNIYSFREKKILIDYNNSSINPKLTCFLPRTDHYIFKEYNFFIMEKLQHIQFDTLSFENKFKLMIEMTKAVQTFHDHKILLNDMKRDHFMYDAKQNLKLIDFNLSLLFKDEIFDEEENREYLQVGSDQLVKDFEGTIIYQSFEKRFGDGFLSKKSDYYPLGLILLQVFLEKDENIINLGLGVIDKNLQKRDLSIDQLVKMFDNKKLAIFPKDFVFDFFEIIAKMTKKKKEDRCSLENVRTELTTLKNKIKIYNVNKLYMEQKNYEDDIEMSVFDEEEEIENYDYMDYH